MILKDSLKQQIFSIKYVETIVIANINRNILLADMQYYVARMNEGGEIYFSGFYESDLPMIKAEAERLGLCYMSHRVEKEWTAAQFRLTR